MGLDLGSRSVLMDWTRHPFRMFFGSTSQTEEWAKQSECFLPRVSEPQDIAGAVFTMGRGGSGSDSSKSLSAGHVGLVISDNGDGTITTIEGNVSNGLRSYTRDKAKIRGFVRWWVS